MEANGRQNFEIESGVRFFREFKPKDGQGNRRNPITQEGIHDKELGLPSKGNPRGMKIGEFSGNMKGSFQLAYEIKETEEKDRNRNRKLYEGRNPITLENEPLGGKVSKGKSEKYEKFVKSKIFDEPCERLSPVKAWK